MVSLRGQKIIIATHNPGKLEEFRALLQPHGLELVSAGELGLPEPEETADSFIGNARIKAQSAMRGSGLIAMADDSGLCVEALDGAPGVYTADWAGIPRDWGRAMTKVEHELQARLAPNRRAHFVCTLLVLWPDDTERVYEGRAGGDLVWPPRGALGHGYDPMFVPDGQKLTFAEMSEAEKNERSHRSNAMEKLVRDLL